MCLCGTSQSVSIEALRGLTQMVYALLPLALYLSFLEKKEGYNGLNSSSHLINMRTKTYPGDGGQES